MNKPVEVSQEYYDQTKRIVFIAKRLVNANTLQAQIAGLKELQEAIQQLDPTIQSVRGTVGGHSNRKPDLDQLDKKPLRYK